MDMKETRGGLGNIAESQTQYSEEVREKLGKIAERQASQTQHSMDMKQIRETLSNIAKRQENCKYSRKNQGTFQRRAGEI